MNVSWVESNICRHGCDVRDMNILQIIKKTLTIEKPYTYLLLTKFIFIKINRIEFDESGSILVLDSANLAKSHFALCCGQG